MSFPSMRYTANERALTRSNERACAEYACVGSTSASAIAAIATTRWMRLRTTFESGCDRCLIGAMARDGLWKGEELFPPESTPVALPLRIPRSVHVALEEVTLCSLAYVTLPLWRPQTFLEQREHETHPRATHPTCNSLWVTKYFLYKVRVLVHPM